MKSVKKIFNVEYDLSSADFIAQKQDSVSQEYQDRHPNDIVKVTTFTVQDKQLIISTTQDNVDFMGATNKMLASRAMSDETFLTMDDDMVRTYEITITANTDLPDYITALNVAQAKADEMFEADDSKMPLVTVIDYRWGNPKTVVGASIFSTTDEDGNKVSLIGATDSAANVVVGDVEAGDGYINGFEDTVAKIVIRDIDDIGGKSYGNLTLMSSNDAPLTYSDVNIDMDGVVSEGTLFHANTDTINVYWWNGNNSKARTEDVITYTMNSNLLRLSDIYAVGTYMYDNDHETSYTVDFVGNDGVILKTIRISLPEGSTHCDGYDHEYNITGDWLCDNDYWVTGNAPFRVNDE